MRSRYQSSLALPSGIIDSIRYEVVMQDAWAKSRFQVCSTTVARFVSLLEFKTLEDWLQSVAPEHQTHVRDNWGRAFVSDCIVSAYRRNFGDEGSYWVLDYAECWDEPFRLISGLLLVGDDIDSIARVMEGMIIR